MSNRQVLNNGKLRGEADIIRLTSRRKAIVESLETARMALKKFLDREVDLEDLQPFFLDPNSDKAREKALRLWLLKTGQSIPDLKVPLTYAIESPVEVDELMNAMEVLNKNKSKDPGRYWDENKGQFFPLEVTKEESEKIIDRNRLYSKLGLENLGAFTVNLVDLINYANSTERVIFVPADVRRMHPYLTPFLEFRQMPSGALRSMGYFEYRLKKDVFATKGPAYVAFDELIIPELQERWTSF